MRRGFTLIELSYVLALIGLISALAIPTYDALVRRAKAAEARANLEAIAHAEYQHFRDHGVFLECPATGPIPAATSPFPTDAPCWSALGVRISGEVRYRYAVQLEGATFQVIAEADLDHDGVSSRFILHGQDRHVEAEQELE
jgi:prepilin-type N-terminal cleavage/methylation domain-containing protein